MGSGFSVCCRFRVGGSGFVVDSGFRVKGL